MTEEEWILCADFDKFWTSSSQEQVRYRQWRLYACACCRLIPEFMASVPDLECLTLAEAEADGLKQPEDAEYPSDEGLDIRWYRRDARSIGHRAATAYRDFVWRSERLISKSDLDWTSVHTLADRPLCDLFREIFGNPFRPISINPTWLTPTVRNLATVAYEERILPSGELDTARLAILADALEESGCDNEDVLGHLRSRSPHVRGCHVVDLILGRD